MYIYIHACTHVRAGLINCWGCGLKCNRKEPHGKSPWAVLEIFLGQLHGYSAWQRLLLAQVTLVLFPYAPRLLSVVAHLAINGRSHGNIPREMRAIKA